MARVMPSTFAGLCHVICVNIAPQPLFRPPVQRAPTTGSFGWFRGCRMPGAVLRNVLHARSREIQYLFNTGSAIWIARRSRTSAESEKERD